MNVLILTPDAVGSTLLQRLITIYMQFHEFNRPVINLHELTNGLEKYFSPEFNQPIVSKRKVQNWGYYQSLQDIVELLNSVDHYKTSRLAQYHMHKRQDSLDQQIAFYQYLDDNFFVIACRRHNIFEHALSMSINNITKKLNVFSHQEKLNSFIDMYATPTDIDERVFVSQLETYKKYLEWSTRYFNIGSYFYYDEHVDNIESYILNLPIFNGQSKKWTWHEKFGIDFNDWNRLHHAPSDLGSLSMTAVQALKLGATNKQPSTQQLELYQQIALSEWPEVNNDQDFDGLPDNIKKQFGEMSLQINARKMISQSNQDLDRFVCKHAPQFREANRAIDRMQELDIIVSPPPIKKQTLCDKLHTVKNFNKCLDIYNEWISNHRDLGCQLTHKDLESQQQKEQRFWRSFNQATAISDQPSIEQLVYQNDDDHVPNQDS